MHLRSTDITHCNIKTMTMETAIPAALEVEAGNNYEH